MDHVAGAAGVTKPVLYQHFRSKRHLYGEVLEDTADRLVAVIAEAAVVPPRTGPVRDGSAQAPASAHDSGRAKVERGVAAYFCFVADNQAAFRLLFGGGTKRDTEFAGVVARVEDTLAGLVARLIDADIESGHRQVLGHAIVGMAEGACRHWLASPHPVDARELAREVAELAWAGLRGVSRG